MEIATQEDIEQLETENKVEEVSLSQQSINIQNEASEKAQQSAADAQAAIDSANF